jgi:hypothetical protein
MSFCHREPVDSELWIKPMNATLLNLWLMGALFGAAVAFLAHLYIHRSTTSRQMPGYGKRRHTNETRYSRRTDFLGHDGARTERADDLVG